mmetsp:Transcript_20086/g.24831  ORF Transcript_20086/g.24831 Transcript_20086/m.24831 type:complete len:364 (+) Transcript_20086:159-1250(+)
MDEDKTYNLKAYEDVISKPVVDLRALRNLSWNGIPDMYRPLAWKILLGYLPANSSRRASTLNRKRKEYHSFSKHHLTPDSVSNHDREILRQGQMDIPRTASDITLIQNKRVQSCLEKLLFTFAMRHPASSYVQGMNDLATPFFIVFLKECFKNGVTGMDDISDDVLADIEADSYWCLVKLLSGIQDHYTPDQPGIQRMTFRLEELMKRVDCDLCSYLNEKGIEMMHFSFKWMSCYFVRELPLRSVIRLWDTYLSEEGNNGFDNFHIYVCAALLSHFSQQLRAMDFDTLHYFLQKLPINDWSNGQVEDVLSKAFVMQHALEQYLALVTAPKPPTKNIVSTRPKIFAIFEAGCPSNWEYDYYVDH